jgi:transcriptional regulator with PAS, ATPase and Fis domain
VRELRNVIERAVILETTQEIQLASLPDFQLEGRLRKTGTAIALGSGSLDESMAKFERELIVSVLEQNRFSLSKSAEQLRISRHALRYRMQRLNIGSDAAMDEDVAVTNGKDSSR